MRRKSTTEAWFEAAWKTNWRTRELQLKLTEAETKIVQLEAKCGEALQFLNELGEGKIMECCTCNSTDTMFQETDIADRYEELRDRLSGAPPSGKNELR